MLRDHNPRKAGESGMEERKPGRLPKLHHHVLLGDPLAEAAGTSPRADPTSPGPAMPIRALLLLLRVRLLRTPPFQHCRPSQSPAQPSSSLCYPPCRSLSGHGSPSFDPFSSLLFHLFETIIYLCLRLIPSLGEI